MFTHCHSVGNTKTFARFPAEYIKRLLNDRSVSLVFYKRIFFFLKRCETSCRCPWPTQTFARWWR